MTDHEEEDEVYLGEEGLAGAVGEIVPYEARGAIVNLFETLDENVVLSGPAGCVAPETRFYDPTTGRHETIRSLYRSQRRPVVQTLWGPVLAEVPFLKGVARLYRVKLRSGRSVLATGHHRLLTEGGWKPVSQCSAGDSILVSDPCPPQISLEQCPYESLLDGSHCCQTAQGSGHCCFADCRQRDGQPRLTLDSDPFSFPSLSDAHEHSRGGLLVGDRVGEGEHTRPCLSSFLPSKKRSILRAALHPCTLCVELLSRVKRRGLVGAWYQSSEPSQTKGVLQQPTRVALSRVSHKLQSFCLSEHTPRLSGDVERFSGEAPASRQPQRYSDDPHTLQQQLGAALDGDTYNSAQLHSSTLCYPAQWDTVESITFERVDAYYDLHVPGAEHYLAEGIWHHNTGKSRGALEYMHYLMLNFPGARGLIARKTLVSLTESGLVTYRQHVLHQLDGVYFYGGSKSEPAAFRYKNGSELLVGGLDKISRVMSKDYDVIFVQEGNEITEDEYERLDSRLRNGVIPFQRFIMDVNPQAPWHWIKRRSERGLLRMIESRHEDNPILYTADGVLTTRGAAYMRRLDNLTGVRYLRLRKGIWAAAEGIVYDEFDPSVHVITPFKIPDDWTRIRVIDFGYVNPFVCLWFAVSPDGIMYLYREWYRAGKIVSDHAKSILHYSGKKYFAATVADHDAEDRATLHAQGIRTIPAKKSILPGIEAVQKRLRINPVTGKAGLYIFSNCLVNKQQELADEGKPTSVLEEFYAYAWGEEKRDKLSKETPIDLDNHGMDALRYAVMHFERAGRTVGPGGATQEKSKWRGRHAIAAG